LHRVIFKNTEVYPQIETALWSKWSSSNPDTDYVYYADYNTTGPGTSNIDRVSFATELTEAEAALYNITSALGSDWSSWVDTSYLINDA
jgi:pectinesterase